MALPFEMRKPVSALSAQELMLELVEDAILLAPTPLPRFIAAIQRVAGLTKITEDQVFASIIEQKAAATGNTLMPLG